MADGITREYRHETHLQKIAEQLTKHHREWHTKNPREWTSITDYSSRVIRRELLGVGRWHRSIPVSTWIESSSQPTLMIGHFPIFRKSRILFELAASLGGSQQLRVDQIIPDNLRNGNYHQRILSPTLKSFLGDAQSHYPTIVLHNIQSLKDLLRPTPADWHPPMLVSSTQRKTGDGLLSDHQSHEHWYLPLQQSPTPS